MTKMERVWPIMGKNKIRIKKKKLEVGELFLLFKEYWATMGLEAG